MLFGRDLQAETIDNVRGGASLYSSQCLSYSESVAMNDWAGYFLTNPIPTQNRVLTPALIDPISGVGTNGLGIPLNNYVDIDPTGAIGDYKCGNASYKATMASTLRLRISTQWMKELLLSLPLQELFFFHRMVSKTEI